MNQFDKCNTNGKHSHIGERFLLTRVKFETLFLNDSASELDSVGKKSALLSIQLKIFFVSNL